MSWSRRSVALFLAAAVGACGFRPLYRKDAGDPGVMHALGQIKIMNVRAEKPENDRLGQQMQNLLRERLTPDGAPQQPLYKLESNLQVSVARTGIQITEEATRARLTVNSTFVLLDTATGAVLYRGTEQSVNSYNVADSQYATMSAENDAAFRAVREISDSIRIRLAIYFERANRS